METKLTSGFALSAGPPISIDFTASPAVKWDTLLGIVDTTLGAELYVADDTTLLGTWQGRVLVLNVVNPGVTAGDELFVWVGDGRTPAGDDTLGAFAATQHADEQAALAVLDLVATENTLRAVRDVEQNFSDRNHADLSRIATAIEAQRDDTLWTDDSRAFYVRNNNRGTITWTDISGNPSAAPGIGARPAAGDDALLDKSSYQAIVAGTGYAVGDLVDHVVTTDPKTAALVGHYWINLSAEALISAPKASDIEPLSRLPDDAARASLQTSIGTTAHQDAAALSAQLPATIGQKAAAASLAVVLSPDQTVVPVSGQTPVGQAPVNPPVSVAGMDGGGLKRHILTDATGAVQIVPRSNVASVVAAGTVQNVGDAITVPCDGMNTAVIKLSALTGSPTGAGVFEVSFGDADWFAVNAIPYGGGAPVTGASASTSPQAFEFAEGGVSAFRFRVTTAFSAAQPVRGIASNGFKSVRVGNTPQQPLNVAGTFSASFSALTYWHEAVAKQGSGNIVGASRASGAAQGQASQWAFFEAIVESSVPGTLTVVNEDQPLLNIVRAVKAGAIDRETVRAFGSSFHAEFLPSASGTVSLSTGFTK